MILTEYSCAFYILNSISNCINSSATGRYGGDASHHFSWNVGVKRLLYAMKLHETHLILWFYIVDLIQWSIEHNFSPHVQAL